MKKRNPAKAVKLVKTLLHTELNQAKAAELLHVTPQAISDQVHNNPLVREALEIYKKELFKVGGTFERSAKDLVEAMGATVVVTATHKGKIKDERAYVDYPTRLKANELFLKIHRLLTDAKGVSEDPANSQHLHFHLGDVQTNEIVTEIRNQLTTLGEEKPKVPRRNPRKVRD